MSSTKKVSQRRVATPMCKVCIDAGKSEKIFTSHFTKNRDGKVCCPTLLSQKCRRCDGIGHTVKYCVASISKKSPSPTNIRDTDTDIVSPKKKKSGFAVLDDDDEEEDDYFTKEKNAEFPLLSNTSTIALKKVIGNWAEIAAKPPIIIATPSPVPVIEKEKEKENKIVNENVDTLVQTLYNKRIATKTWTNWADCVDSDDDDDYFDNNFDNDNDDEYSVDEYSVDEDKSVW